MADGKLTYDIDFNVHTEAISRDVARAVDSGLYRRVYGSAYSGSQSYDVVSNSVSAAGTYNIGQNAGVENYLTEVARRAASSGSDPFGAAIARIGLAHNHSRLLPAVQASLGIGTPYFDSLGVSSVTDFAYAATSRQFGYTPATAQTMINSAVLASLRGHGVKVLDKSYEFETQYNTQSVRAAQNQQRKTDLAGTLWSQGDMYYSAAEAATSPSEKRALYRKAASSYRSVSNRTLVESGAVTPDMAMGAIAAATEMDALASRADEKDIEYGIIARLSATREAQEDAAWAARERELAYSPSQKAREMEMGWRAIEASSATEDIYNPAKDIYAQQQGVGNAITAARGYLLSAARHEEGSVERKAYLKLASSAINGITPSSMSKVGLESDQIEENTIALQELTDQIRVLSGEGGGGGNGAGVLPGLIKALEIFQAVTNTATAIGVDIMATRTGWLADTKTPYQTRRSARQDMAQRYGAMASNVSIAGGAAIGAAIGSVIPGIGTAVGAGIGAVGAGVVSLAGNLVNLQAQHYKDEKQLGDAYQTRAIDMARYYNLYGEGVNYNYAQMAEGTGYISADSMLRLNQTADMLPGAMAFGAVGEQEMMALSMMPTYYASLMEGRSTIEIAEAYRKDIMNLPREFRQYITSILPGANEDLRAFVSSDQYGAAYMNGYSTQLFDKQQRRFIPGLEAARYGIAYNNVRDVNNNMMTEVPKLGYPNYMGSPEERMWAEYNAGVAGTLLNSKNVSNNMLEAINSVWTGDKNHSKLGDIIIQIDGNTIHQQPYTYDDFLTGAQSYVVGG